MFSRLVQFSPGEQKKEKRSSKEEQLSLLPTKHVVDSLMWTLASSQFQLPNLMIVCSGRFSVLSLSLGKYTSLMYSRYLSSICTWKQIVISRVYCAFLLRASLCHFHWSLVPTDVQNEILLIKEDSGKTGREADLVARYKLLLCLHFYQPGR